MVFKVAVVFYSLHGRLVTTANVIAEGAAKVPGAEVTVYRVRDPIKGDDHSLFDEGVLDAPVATIQDIKEADAVILGAPGRQGGMCGEMRLFLDSLAPLQVEKNRNSAGALKGKVGSAFTSVGGHSRGYGGHEAILQSFHAFFLQHGMVVVGNPPTHIMEDAALATPFGVVMAGKETARFPPALNEYEVKLAYSMGEWTAQVAKLLHDSEVS
ncbi:flavo protein WrbA [Coccomyxa subellipsoidea C-169]|uniref:NAD(P)H dehydrogenase (quinone) n=1 Tax=Coccomyxa subellipsoidea (strain C-169) TaxID=574566 RepID=I0Z0A6_COCSC|nr:flavo protein WrbA [Coccomyxa subellipsoidea C-169]EIE24075.1 flavo protein WrbA [Coccomyxa subellipsoidea C-169]|eukprot:XP_005648619.1 flavo protein WrbA [Coccomyxa subellipsoidea C-169]